MLTPEFVYSANHPQRRLFVKVLGGLCNRIRVIASGRRAAKLLGMRLTVIWTPSPDAPVPHWSRFFAPMRDVEFTDKESIDQVWKTMEDHVVYDSYERYQHLVTYPFMSNRVASCHAFSFKGLPKFTMEDLRDFMPLPTQEAWDAATKAIDDFRDDHEGPIIGIHIRSTDLLTSKEFSPKELFIRRMEEFISMGYKLVLATDSPETRDAVLAEFPYCPHKILVIPKKDMGQVRWPLPPDPESVVEDWIELLALGFCDFVCGSYQSSFSATAFALNGSDKCRFIQQVGAPPDPYLIPYRKDLK